MDRFSNAWTLMRQSARSHAVSMASMVDDASADMITTEAEKFCNLQMPTTPAQLRIRRLQLSDLIARVGAISHANSIVQLYPQIAHTVFDVVRKYLNSSFAFKDDEATDSLNPRAARLTLSISRLCHAERLHRVRS